MVVTLQIMDLFFRTHFGMKTICTLVYLDIWENHAACLVTVTGLQCLLLFLYITLIIAGILIVVALLALNMTVAGGLIDGFILYADIVAVGRAGFFYILRC